MVSSTDPFLLTGFIGFNMTINLPNVTDAKCLLNKTINCGPSSYQLDYDNSTASFDLGPNNLTIGIGFLNSSQMGLYNFIHKRSFLYEKTLSRTISLNITSPFVFEGSSKNQFYKWATTDFIIDYRTVTFS